MIQLDAEKIPAELKASRRWLAWRWGERDGKRTKLPCHPREGYDIDGTKESNWLSFDEALTSPIASGVGFAVGGSGYVGVDLDGCIDPENGELAGWAKEIVEKLDSYTEITPSGRGLRVWVKAKLPPGRRRRGPLEMYDSGRYFTVTGEHFDGTPEDIHERGEELNSIHAKVFGSEDDAATRPLLRPAPSPVSLSDQEILDRMFRASNGDRIRSLFNGDIPAGKTGSEADLALCSHLAFYTGGDVDAIKRLFEQSALCDDKWTSRPDYQDRTIEVALSQRSFYDPSYRSKTNGHGAPRLAVLPSEPEGGGNLDGDGPEEPNNLTDLGNARRLVDAHGDDIRFCEPWNKWLGWVGDRWKVDETGSVYRMAHHVIRCMHQEALDSDSKPLATWAMRSEEQRRINSMVSLSRHLEGVPILPDQLDAPPWLLNCPNGTLDLKTGRLRPHIRSDHLTKRCAADFDPDATCPVWDAFLTKIMDGDSNMVDYLRRAVGYALTASVAEHALFFLYGTGRNGKSTFLNTLLYVLADYAITINADVLTVKKGEDHPTGIADLQGRRFVATIEVEDGRRLAESLVKTITSEDRIRARRMRQDFYEFDPTHKIFLAANHKPMVRGTDEGIWRRIKLIPFSVQIPIEDVDKTLAARLRSEAPGILAWAVRGCLEWQQSGLADPLRVSSATAEYRAEMDELGDFIAERCVVHPAAQVKISSLYAAYVEWSRDTGSHQHSQRKFSMIMTERGFAATKANSVNWREGIKLIKDDD